MHLSLDEKRYVMGCTIYYHVRNLTNVKNTHRGKTPSLVFFTFFKLYE